jgi:hypothetical protein
MLILKKDFKLDPVDSVKGRIFDWEDDDATPSAERTRMRIAFHGNPRFEEGMRALLAQLEDEEAREDGVSEERKDGFRKKKKATKAEEKKKEALIKKRRRERIAEEAPRLYAEYVWLGADNLALDRAEDGTLTMAEVGPATVPSEIYADDDAFWAFVAEGADAREEILRAPEYKHIYNEIHETCMEEGFFFREARETEAKNSPGSSTGSSGGDPESATSETL